MSDDLSKALSPREREVVLLLAKGSSTQEAANTLRIAHGTVRSRIASIYEKLGIRSRAELVAHPRVTEMMEDQEVVFSIDPREVRNALSPRRFEVFKLLGQGLMLQAIADELHIEYSTVRSHVLSIYQALGTHERATLVRLYMAVMAAEKEQAERETPPTPPSIP